MGVRAVACHKQIASGNYGCKQAQQCYSCKEHCLVFA